jgi:hypothetical protein
MIDPSTDKSALAAHGPRFVLSHGALTLILVVLSASVLALGYLLGTLRAPVVPASPRPAMAQSGSGANRPNTPSHTNSWRAPVGPWGELICVPIQIEPPPQFIGAGWDKELVVQWFFAGMTETQLEEFVRSVSLPPKLAESLCDRTRWTTEAEGIVVKPTRETILQIPAAAREKIYSVLARSPRNVPHQYPYRFRPELIDDRFANSQVQPDTIRLVRSLLYSRGERLLFSDMPTVMDGLPDSAARVEFVKSCARVRTMVIELVVAPGMDTAKICHYWSRGGRAKDVKPLLDSLARLPGGWSLDIAHLIPPFARKRLYTFPYPDALSQTVRQDCHWSSFNFFNEPPDDQFGDATYTADYHREHYYQVSTDFELGDIVFFTLPSGAVAHSAVHVAGDIVFTRNGFDSLTPWIFSTLDDVQDSYEAIQPDGAKLNVTYWRRKDS